MEIHGKLMKQRGAERQNDREARDIDTQMQKCLCKYLFGGNARRKIWLEFRMERASATQILPTNQNQWKIQTK